MSSAIARTSGESTWWRTSQASNAGGRKPTPLRVARPCAADAAWAAHCGSVDAKRSARSTSEISTVGLPLRSTHLRAIFATTADGIACVGFIVSTSARCWTASRFIAAFITYGPSGLLHFSKWLTVRSPAIVTNKIPRTLSPKPLDAEPTCRIAAASKSDSVLSGIHDSLAFPAMMSAMAGSGVVGRGTHSSADPTRRTRWPLTSQPEVTQLNIAVVSAEGVVGSGDIDAGSPSSVRTCSSTAERCAGALEIAANSHKMGAIRAHCSGRCATRRSHAGARKSAFILS